MWFGTASSTINVFKAPDSSRREWGDMNDRGASGEKTGIVKDHDVVHIKGEPRMVDKHMMNNKRFALTVNSAK